MEIKDNENQMPELAERQDKTVYEDSITVEESNTEPVSENLTLISETEETVELDTELFEVEESFPEATTPFEENMTDEEKARELEINEQTEHYKPTDTGQDTDMSGFKKVEEQEDFDEEEIFCRMATDENIFNSRGLSHAPRMEETCKDRYNQMGCCAQMHSYQWTDSFAQMSATSDFPIVQVRFKNTHKDFYRIPEGEKPEDFQTGDIVTVESTNGHDTGIICLKGELVRLQLKKKGMSPDSPAIKKIYRKARQNDIDKWTETIQAEKEMQRRARIIAAQLGLSMKINNVEIQGDYTKAIFYYTADDRVDFRQLIKIYAEEFKVRIEMRQIGARQESGILGGIGSCGRELCCVTFLHNFTSVGTHAARVQQVSLNPQKLAGQCSKLKCCLNFEYEVYMDAIKSMPDQKVILKTEKGDARCIKTDPLKRTLTYAYEEIPGSYVEISADKVLEIMEKNRNGELVGNLNDFSKPTSAPVEPQASFQQVVGQDDLTRFDKPKKKNKNKNKNGKTERQEKQTGKVDQPQEKRDSKPEKPESPSKPNGKVQRNEPKNEIREGKTNHENKEGKEPDPKKNKNRRQQKPLQKPILKNATNETHQ